MKRLVLLAVTSALVFCPAPSSASEQPMDMPASDTRGKPPTPEDMKMAGERFLKGAFSGNLLHIRASAYALTQVNDPEIRSLAEKLIQDHTMANQKLSAVAQAKGVELPTDLLPPQKTMLESAMQVKGEMFATTYLINMDSLHVRDILEFSHVAADSTDEAIKAFAAETLPALKEHYAMIRPIAEAKVKLQGTLEGN